MPTDVTAAVVRSHGAPFSVEELTLNDPLEDEVLVRIVAVGVCHTDLHAAAGAMGVPLPAVLGHEGAGIIERVGARVKKLKAGDHVVLAADFCGICDECQRGRMVYCVEQRPRNFFATGAGQSTPYARNGERIHGMFFGQSSFGTYALSHENNAVKVRDDVPLEKLGPLGCGVQTGVGGIVSVLRPEPGTSIVIIGTGSVGLSALIGAGIAGCTTIVAVDTMDARLDAAESFGATHRIRAGDVDLTAALLAIRPSGFHYAFDTTGYAPAIEAAILALGARGTIGLVAGTREARVPLPIQHVFQRGITVRGMIQGESVPGFIPRLVDLYAAGKVPLDRLITTYPLAEINHAIDEQHHGRAVKPVLVC